MRTEKKRMLAIIWLLVILLLSAYPGSENHRDLFLPFDKIVHFLLYLILSIILIIAFLGKAFKINTHFVQGIFVFFFAAFYGIIMEVMQHYFCVNRSGNIYDLIANLAGSLVGLMLFPSVIKLRLLSKWFDQSND